MTDKPYPIGTKLITRRLSQAALYAEIFGDSAIETAKPVTVTEGNQKWLSPAPIEGDWVEYSEDVAYRVGKDYTGLLIDTCEGTESPEGKPVILRNYPNGQRLPLIEWDEVSE